MVIKIGHNIGDGRTFKIKEYPSIRKNKNMIEYTSFIFNIELKVFYSSDLYHEIIKDIENKIFYKDLFTKLDKVVLNNIEPLEILKLIENDRICQYNKGQTDKKEEIKRALGIF